MATGPALFIGIGTDRYDDDELADLTRSVAEVSRVASLVGDHFEKQVLADAREVDVRGALAASKESTPPTEAPSL